MTSTARGRSPTGPADARRDHRLTTIPGRLLAGLNGAFRAMAPR